MTDPIFVDSNILVYRRDLTAGPKQKAAEQWLRVLWERRAGRLSMQVLHEFYVTVTHKLSPGLPHDDAREEIRDYFAWQPVPLSHAVLEEAWNVEQQFKLAFWDSLIVSAAHVAGCRYLLTEDLQDGQDLDGLVVVDPFRHSTDEFGL
jgi:predicted nucleic acid-binding protein